MEMSMAVSRQLRCQRCGCSGGPGSQWQGVQGAAWLGEVECVVGGLDLFLEQR
jgi:hypothetical protein